MDRGEWWLDESGYLTFADGDVGDANHEMIAFQAALGLDDGNPVHQRIEVGRLLPAEARYLRMCGSDPKAIAFFSKGNPDARLYAVQYMGWIRVKGPNADVWTFDDDALKRLQDADFWDEDDADNEQEFFIEEVSTRKTWSVPIKVLLKAVNVAQVKAYVAGYQQGFDGLGRRCRCR